VCYDTNFASKVLRHLCNVRGAPSKLTPSLRQWRALVNICAGSLAESQFPCLLIGFERLLNLQLRVQGCPSPPDPETLARAISILGELSRGTLVTATFAGGLDCAWIAALAQWLLCLSVEIIDQAGSCIY